jgi:hypothetical protein
MLIVRNVCFGVRVCTHSDRVAGAGCFGAALMLQPEVVAECMAAMGEAAQGTPVNVKCRLGVDQVSQSLLAWLAHLVLVGITDGLNNDSNEGRQCKRWQWLHTVMRLHCMPFNIAFALSLVLLLTSGFCRLTVMMHFATLSRRFPSSPLSGISSYIPGSVSSR